MLFVIFSFAVWRISYMLWTETGPFDIFQKLRSIFIKETRRGTKTRWFFGDLLLCIKCLSVWVAAPFAWYLGNNLIEFVAYTAALSGVAIVINATFTRVE
jgi:Protein of unknown function (DUF1360)